jgi:hypothetical protein
LPIPAVLTSLTISLIQISGIGAGMRVMRPEFREEMGALRSDFTTLTGKVIEIDNRLER